MTRHISLLDLAKKSGLSEDSSRADEVLTSLIQIEEVPATDEQKLKAGIHNLAWLLVNKYNGEKDTISIDQGLYESLTYAALREILLLEKERTSRRVRGEY